MDIFGDLKRQVIYNLFNIFEKVFRICSFGSLHSLHFQKDQDNSFESLGYTMFWLTLSSCCAPYIAMSSIDDYKVRVSN